jgi:hypothetical protein
MTPVPAVRLAVGYGAVAATVPYLALKVLWLSGGTVGLADPGFFSDHPAYTFGNLLTVGMDAVAVLIALAFTHAWGRRIPAWLVLLPVWAATGFLAPIVVFVPFVPAAFGVASGGSDPLESWVYLFVYGGFAAQGLLLTAAFVLYAESRWGEALASRNGDAASGPTHALQSLLTLIAAPLAAAVGLLHLAWALGSRVGLPEAVLSDLPAAYGPTNGVYAAFAFAATVGLPMLVYPLPRHGRLWVPLALAWAGAGSMLAWGSWQMATMAVRPELGTPLLGLAMGAKVLAAVLAGVVMVLLLRERFGRIPHDQEAILPTARHDVSRLKGRVG